MKRTNQINIVREIYKTYPDIEDVDVLNGIISITKKGVSFKTLSVWKARLRKEGIFIPDKRKKGVLNDKKEFQKS